MIICANFLIRKFDQYESVIYLYQFWQDNGEENTQNAAFCTQSKSKVVYSGLTGSSGCSDYPGGPAQNHLKIPKSILTYITSLVQTTINITL